MASKRRTWPTTTSSACWVRSGSSPRRPSMTSAAAARAVIGERSSWLTSRREARLALDAGLDGVGHVVERVGEPVEVGVALAHDAGVEVAGGDLAGGVGDPPERAQQAAARPPAGEARQQDRDDRPDDEREQDRAQRVLGRPEPERLEVVGVDLGDLHADADVVLVADVEALHARTRPRSTAWRSSIGEALVRVQGVGRHRLARCRGRRRRSRPTRRAGSGTSRRGCRRSAGARGPAGRC